MILLLFLAVRAGITYSMSLHKYQSKHMTKRKISDIDKFRAIENILCESGSVKQNSVKYKVCIFHFY